MSNPEKLPSDHHTNFPEEWWDERRKRDYYINEDGLVRLHPDSPTGQSLFAALRVEASKIALLLAPPAGSA